jgi:hypothetical protein
MAHVTNDQLLVENPNLVSRAGVTYLGQYRSSNPFWVRAKRDLSKQVSKPAVDRGLERRLTSLYTELDYGKDNRSVTDSEWVEKGIAKFGCPIHSASNGTGTSFTIPGSGVCCCRRGQRPDSRVHSPLRTDVGMGFQAYHGRSVVEGPRSSGRDGFGHDGRDGGTELSSGRAYASPQDGVGPFETVAYRSAVSAALSVAGSQAGGRKPYSMARVVETEIHRTHYAGAPFFCSNDLVLDRAVLMAEDVWRGSGRFHPYTAGRRVQRGKSGPKTRLVWMASLVTTLVGSRFSKPVFKGLERKRPFSFSLRGVEKAALVEEFKSRFKFVYSIDVSGFDASMSARIIDDAFGIARTHLDLDEGEELVWDRFKSDFIHSRLITPKGDVYQVHRGIPSGNPFTSIIGSLCNLIALNYILIRTMGRTVDKDRVQIQGDDSIIGLNTYVPLAEMSAVAGELGLSLSVEKSRVTGSLGELDTPVHYLGYTWQHGRPHRDLHEVVSSLVLPERHSKRDDAMSLLRLISSVQNSIENYQVFRWVYSNPAIVQAFFECSNDMRDIDGEGLAVSELSGQLRYLIAVEGRTDLLPRAGKVISLMANGPWA